VQLSPVPISGPAVVETGASSFAVWTDMRTAVGVYVEPQLLGAWADPDVTAAGAGVAVAMTAVPQMSPAIASSPNVAVAAWIEPTYIMTADVVATLIGGAGQPRDPITIDTAADPGSVSVVFTGRVFVVLYSRQNQVLAKRISLDGTLLDGAPIFLGEGWAAVAASNGSTSVVVFANGNGVFRLLLNPDGTKSGAAPVQVSEIASSQTAIATNGDEFLVTWVVGSDWWQFPSPNKLDVLAARLDGSGALLDPKPIAIADSVRDEGGPAVASDGRDFAVAYVDDGVVEVKKVLREGALAGTSAANGTRVREGESVAIAAFGGHYIMASTNSREQSVFASAVNFDAMLLEDPQRIPDSDPGGYRPAIASFGSGALLAYAHAPHDAVFGSVPHVFVRPLSDTPGRARAVRH
jgi:hypothetical protein